MWSVNLQVHLDVNLDVKGQIALRYDSRMKNKAVLVGAILVAIFVATVATLMVVRDQRENAARERQTGALTNHQVRKETQAPPEPGDRIDRILIALTTTQQFKIAVAQHHQSKGRWPASNKDVGLPLPESFRNEVVRSVVIEPYASTARIRMRFVDAAAKERELQLVVSLNASTGYTWQCFTADFPSLNELAAGCSYRAK